MESNTAVDIEAAGMESNMTVDNEAADMESNTFEDNEALAIQSTTAVNNEAADIESNTAVDNDAADMESNMAVCSEAADMESNMAVCSEAADMESNTAVDNEAAGIEANQAVDYDEKKASLARTKDLVEKCDAVIAANKSLEQKYAKEEAILAKKLHQIRTELRVIRELGTSKPKQEPFRYCSIGMPYFKDKDLNVPSDNEDTLEIKRRQMYDFSNVMAVSGWTFGEKTSLLSVLLDLSKDIVKNKIYSEITNVQKVKLKTIEITAKIKELKSELLAVKHKKLEDLDLKIDQEFDWEEIALKLNNRHSSEEYKAIWDLFFHPRVNKSVWTPKEHRELQRIAAEKGMQDWESIAKTLNTGRTAYQCFVYFRTHMNNVAVGRKWTLKEMNYLQEVISLCKEENYIPWGKVATSMQNRTKVQCYNKYMGMIRERKGRFLPEEDAVILNFVNVYGQSFRKMSSFLTGRSAIQLRARYKLLLKIRVSTTWTVDEDRKLMQIMANQDCRSHFSTASKHFPGKDRQHIRTRYNTLIRWTKRYPHKDLCQAPRRGARRLYHGEPTSSLVKAIENLREKMKAELQQNHDKPKKRVKKLTRDSSESAIHDAILTTISTLEAKNMQSTSVVPKTQEDKVEGAYQMLNVQDISSAPDEQANIFNVQNFLFLLNAKIADKTKFYNSSIGEAIKKIENQKVNLTQPTVRTYSKIAVKEQVIQPSLFGTTTAGRRRFMIPPNFATITGSRVILQHSSKMSMKGKSDMNIKQLARKDLILDSHLTRLKERFVDLFCWPLLLSNEPPEHYKLYAKDMIEKRVGSRSIFDHKPFPEVRPVTAPHPKAVNAGIDTEAMEVDEN